MILYTMLKYLAIPLKLVSMSRQESIQKRVMLAVKQGDEDYQKNGWQVVFRRSPAGVFRTLLRSSDAGLRADDLWRSAEEDNLSADSGLTVAARGLGHQNRSQAQNEIIVEMTSLKGIKVYPEGDTASNGAPVVEVMGGEMWVDVLKACMEHGLAPRSWTDYLYLTVGGTLSTAGVSGQSFRHGPEEVSNVLSLQVVTGNGNIVNCSAAVNSAVFAVLGGPGYCGIITRARIVLEKAPHCLTEHVSPATAED